MAFTSSHQQQAVNRVIQHALRTDFLSYLRKCFATLHPATDYISNWHIELLAEYLNAVEAGTCKRLIINMPPRSLKSLSVSVAWTSYLLGRTPSLKCITASYASALSIKHAMDVRAVIQCPWYQHTFPDFSIAGAQNEKHKFVTTSHGFRLASSVGGTITGEGADIIVIDDPLNPAQSMSANFRMRANNWFDHTLSSRLNDKQRGAMLLVMQRLHENDLTGHLLRKGGWEHLVLPAQAQTSVLFSYGSVKKTMKAGECLQPLREPESVLTQLRADLGSTAFSAQYLQEPCSVDDGMIQQAWLQSARMPDEPPLFVIQSWDTAIKTGAQHDYSVCVTIAVFPDMYYITDVLRLRADFPALKRQVVAMYEKHTPQAVLIEDKASGQSLLQEMRQSCAIPFIAIQPKGDKIMRTARITPLLEAGRLVMPEYAAWKDIFIHELLGFPNITHDDQVDALSQALCWLQAKAQQTQHYARQI